MNARIFEQLARECMESHPVADCTLPGAPPWPLGSVARYFGLVDVDKLDEIAEDPAMFVDDFVHGVSAAVMPITPAKGDPIWAFEYGCWLERDGDRMHYPDGDGTNRDWARRNEVLDWYEAGHRVSNERFAHMTTRVEANLHD